MKRISIFLVVTRHVLDGPLANLIYVFHMPLFFIIGGYLFQPGKNIKAHAIHKARGLLVPYLAFLALIGGPLWLGILIHGDGQAALHQGIWLILGGEKLIGPLGAFWFTTCYFGALIGHDLLWRLPGFWRHLSMLAFAEVWPDAWLPWAINVIAMAIPLMHLGSLARRMGTVLWHPPLWVTIVVAISSMAYMAAVWANFLPPMAMKRAGYGTSGF